MKKLHQKDVSYLSFLQALRRREGLFRVLMFTLVTVICWIGFSIVLGQGKTKIPLDVQQHTLPLNPNIDRRALQEIQSRQVYTAAELGSFPIYKIELDEEGNQRMVSSTGEVIPISQPQPTPVPVTIPQGSTAEDPTATPTPQATPVAQTPTPAPTAAP